VTAGNPEIKPPIGDPDAAGGRSSRPNAQVVSTKEGLQALRTRNSEGDESSVNQGDG
jgi:hypothetical protein